jgi:hypothetical protein
MELANRWQDRNLPKLESVIAWTVIIIIMGIFLRYTLVIFAHAEMSSLNTTVLNINSAIQYHAAMAVLKGDYETLTRLVTINPFAQIEEIREDYIETKINETLNILPDSIPFLVRRSNYLGEFTDPDLNHLEDGSWFYENSDNTLVYLVRNEEYFNTELTGNPRIRFKVFIDYEDNNDNHIFEPGFDRFLNIQLRNIEAYDWSF